ncbi:hypothetical protein KEM52_002072 [Ascosphaera acerosa]|nr:hypothetical protein KEM52_002072 [Ascosphaera acerosa]
MSPHLDGVYNPRSSRSYRRDYSPASNVSSASRSATPLSSARDFSHNGSTLSVQSPLAVPHPPYRSSSRSRSDIDLERYAESNHSTTDFLPLPYTGTGRPLTGLRHHSSESLMRSLSRSPSRSRDANASAYSVADGTTGLDTHHPNQSQASSRAYSSSGADDDFATESVAEKYSCHPDEGMIITPDIPETDDQLHNPVPGEQDRDYDCWNMRAFWNIGGIILIVGAILTLFIVYPLAQRVKHEGQKMSDDDQALRDCAENPLCVIGKEDVPLLKNIRLRLIDPDTPEAAMKKLAADGTELHLVFSDEFTKEGRSFYPGDDPYFTAVDLHYAVTQDLEWYDPDAVTTRNGTLEIRFDAFKLHDLDYRSGMLQSWNQFCFKGGRLEASISLPGKGDTIGFWPGFWTMGNLGRPGYAATTEGMWPYSYEDTCDAGITPNQSSTDGISYLPGMKLPACTCKGEDHPTPGVSRSAPEIDVLEASAHKLAGHARVVGEVSQSFQVAPFDVWYMPDYDMVEVYDPEITFINDYTGGPFQQALSGLTTLNNNWYDGKQYQVYAFEYTPGAKGEVTWFVGRDPTWKLSAQALRPNGNVGQRIIPEEPMSVIVNFGMSASFAEIEEDKLRRLMPATMRVDYIRVYQDPKSSSVTCDPEGYETTGYIKDHRVPYDNWNLTSWANTGFAWPKNSLMHGCDAAAYRHGLRVADHWLSDSSTKPRSAKTLSAAPETGSRRYRPEIHRLRCESPEAPPQPHAALLHWRSGPRCRFASLVRAFLAKHTEACSDALSPLASFASSLAPPKPTADTASGAPSGQGPSGESEILLSDEDIVSEAHRNEITTDLRLLMRSVPHPVAIITATNTRARSPQERFRGMTVSSFNTVTLYPEPVVSFNVKTPSESYNAIRRSKRFLVHLLSPHPAMARLARAFARGNQHLDIDSPSCPFRFVSMNYKSNPEQSVDIVQGEPPMLVARNAADATSREVAPHFPFVLECRSLSQDMRVGTHVIVLGKVKRILRPQQLEQAASAETIEQLHANDLCLTYADTRFWQATRSLEQSEFRSSQQKQMER